jgi:hypothetical protein
MKTNNMHPIMIMRNPLHSLCMSLFLFLTLVSCTNEEGDPIHSRQMGDNEVLLSLRLPGASSPATRSLSETDENEVATVDVLVFGTEGYRYSAAASGITDGTMPTGDDKKYIAAVKDFIVKLKLTEEDETVDLWVIANARSMLGSIAIEAGDSKEEIALALIATEEDEVTQIGDAPKAIPMWGMLEEVNIASGSGLGTNNKVNLTRMIARIDVAVAADVNFELISVHFYNRNTKGRIVPEDNGNWTGNVSDAYATTPSLPEEALKDDLPQVYTDVTGNAMTGIIYAFEAEKGDGYGGSGIAYEDEPCLVIGGYYDGSDDPTYYRVDFVQTKDDEGDNLAQPRYLDILRNHQYVVSIAKVSGPGRSDPDGALTARPVNMTADVIQWNQTGMGIVVMDDQYMLSVSRDDITFYQGGGPEEIRVYTDWEDGWKIDPAYPVPDWITLATVPPSTPVSGAQNQTVTLSITQDDFVIDREGVFYITAGRLTKQIKVAQKGLSLVYTGRSTDAAIQRRGGDPVKDINGTSLTMAFDGLSYTGEFQVHAHAGTSTFTSSSDDKDTHPVTVGPNDSWQSREITYSYSGVGVPETAIPDVTNTQLGYSISVTGLTPDALISGTGGAYTFTLGGDFPDGVEIYAVLESDTNTKVSNTATLTANQASVELNIDANPDNITERSVQLIAVHSAGGLPFTVLATYTQQPDPTYFLYMNVKHRLIFWMMSNELPTDGTKVEIPETYRGESVSNFAYTNPTAKAIVTTWVNSGGRAIGESTGFTDQVIAGTSPSPATFLIVSHANIANNAIYIDADNVRLQNAGPFYLTNTGVDGVDPYTWVSNSVPPSSLPSTLLPARIYLAIRRNN